MQYYYFFFLSSLIQKSMEINGFQDFSKLLQFFSCYLSYLSCWVPRIYYKCNSCL
uniref:Uncharacterized protein n=1 Tax=Octopus bimaculoides TaxID=37653 RepID=A0A0L8FNT4_OCTBM